MFECYDEIIATCPLRCQKQNCHADELRRNDRKGKLNSRIEIKILLTTKQEKSGAHITQDTKAPYYSFLYARSDDRIKIHHHRCRNFVYSYE
mmetsp:Transcript_12912/g.19345  ORF Transcript_12912/g.19345 Transcript_12912/m.19345 type:complete len:92 (+) Transcript_12912:169-444(+)